MNTRTLAFITAATLLATGASAGPPEPGRFGISVDVHEGSEVGRNTVGAAMRHVDFELDCITDDAGKKWIGWSCSLPTGEVNVGGDPRADGTLEPLVTTIDPAFRLEVRWRLDGRLKRVRPLGELPAGVADFLGVGVAALALPSPPDGWDATRVWVHRDPAMLNLAGQARVMASSLTLSMVRRDAAGSKIDVEGGGMLDGTTVTLITKGSQTGEVTVRATGTVMLDERDRLVSRTLSLWLHKADAAMRGNLGSQQVHVRRLSSP